MRNFLVRFLRDHRGQLNTGLVWGIIVMLVSIAIGGLVYSKISAETSNQVEENSIGENIVNKTNEGANTVFPLLVLIVVIAVFVSLIAVLKIMG